MSVCTAVARTDATSPKQNRSVAKNMTLHRRTAFAAGVAMFAPFPLRAALPPSSSAAAARASAITCRFSASSSSAAAFCARSLRSMSWR